MRLRAPTGTIPTAAAIGTAGLVVAAAGLVAAGPPATAATGQAIGGARLGSTAVVIPRGGPALPAKLTASSWLVADATTGAVLAARNPHGRFAPASTLKILTALTLLPRLDPRRTIEITNADATVDGSKVGLKPGHRVRIDQVFTALLVVSGNDAANVLARAAGGEPAAVRMMAAEARRLQALDTVPRTVHGLDARGQASSAYDLALLGRAGLAMPSFRRYVSIRRARMPAAGGSFEIANHNRLLGSYPGAIGIKNGRTDAAGSSLVAAARRGNRTVLVTLMHTDSTMWQQAAALLDWGFRAGGRTKPVGVLVGPVPPAAPLPPSTTPPPSSTALPAPRASASPAGHIAIGVGVLLTLAAAGLLFRRRRA